MRIAIAIGLVGSCLLACTDGVLDVGSDDASAALELAPAPTAFSASAVQKANEACARLKNPDASLAALGQGYPPAYSPVALRDDMTGAWVQCVYVGAEAAESASFQFTADGHWYALVEDGDGGLRRATSNSDPHPAVGYQGKYSIVTQVSAAGMARSYGVETDGALWFVPEFPDSGDLIDMTFHPNEFEVCALIEP